MTWNYADSKEQAREEMNDLYLKMTDPEMIRKEQMNQRRKARIEHQKKDYGL